jgi:predicted secreted protein
MHRVFHFPLRPLAPILVALVGLTAMLPIQAQTSTSALPAYSSSLAPQLSLRAYASNELLQDTVTTTLAVEVEAQYQANAGKALTTALDALVKRAKEDTTKVDVRTGSYRVWGVIDNKGKTTGWRGRAEVRLESKDFEAVGALASKLADASAISGTYFSLSQEWRDAEEKRLLSQAAAAFKSRALAAANAFGFSGYRINEINLSGTGGDISPQRPAAMMARRAGKEADTLPNVPLEPDTEVVMVEVSGSIFLQ